MVAAAPGPANASPGTQPRETPVAAQLARTAELDRLRVQRPLTAAELAEAENLSARAYNRAWRGRFRDLNGVAYWKARA